MKKRLFTLALVLALLPTSIFAQTEVVDGLPYLKDATGYYITLDDGTYISNYNLRNQIKTLNPKGNTQTKFYKADLDNFTGELTIPTDNVANYKGIEYFRNLKTLTVTNSYTGTVTMDVSTFTNIEKVIVKGTVRSFTFTTADTNSVKKTLDVSECSNMTSLTCKERGINKLIIKSEDGTKKCGSLQTLSISNTDIGGVLDVAGFTNLVTLYMKHVPVEELNAEGATKLKYLNIKPDQNYLGTWKCYNYDPVTGEGTRLKKINVKGCTSLSELVLTGDKGGQNSSQWYERTVLEEINAEGCTSLTKLQSVNGRISKLNVRGCTSLKTVTLIQNMLTTEAMIEGGLAACPLEALNLHRNRLSSIDFITTPSEVWPQAWKDLAGEYKRKQELCNKLKKLWVNGGSYVKRDYLGSNPDDEYTNTFDYEKEQKDGVWYAWWIEPGDEYTHTIKDINLQYVNNLIYLFCGDNLLTTIDLSLIAPKLQQLEIIDNLFTVLDLSSVNFKNLKNQSWARRHVTFKDLKVLKGGVQQNSDGSYPNDTDGACIPDVLREDGENDMIFLPLDNDAADMIIKDLKVGTEDKSDTRTDAHNYDEAVESHAGMMDIIHLKEGGKMKYYMKTHDGEIHKHSDIDMHRMVVEYNYDTKMMNCDKSIRDIEVKVHTDPYVVYLNPATRSGDGIDYYSGTVCVSYQWEVPKGIEVYIAVGVKDVKLITDKGTTAADGQLNLVCIGKEGDIIPKNTAVYLRSVPAFENVVKADGTPAETFNVDGKKLSHVAGFYDLQNNWEPKYLGWRNTKGAGAVDDRIRLYIEKDGPTRPTVKGKYVTIDGVSTEITDDLLYNRNLLKCYKVEDTTPTEAIYYDTFDKDAKYHYSFPIMATVDNDGSTPLKDNILTLSRETKLGTKMIGFWPYIGSSDVPPHRCYIKVSDVLNPSSPSTSGLTTLSRGLTFHFDNSAETGVREFATVETADTKDNAWYTLSGMRLQEKPTQPGLYINNGKKVYIK